MLNNPKISIIIPSYNRLSLLKEALNSLFAQTYTNWECIVVDDGSTDDTILEMKTLSKQDNRIKFYQRQNTMTGANICRNEGIIASTGEYVIFLDSDDCLAPFCLEKRLKIMEPERELDFAVFPCQLFKEKPGDVGLLWNVNKSESDIDRFLKLDVPWQTSSCIWRRKALVKIELWDEKLLSWQDWEIHLRALIKGLIYEKYVTHPDCYWRMPREETIGSKSVSAEHLFSHEFLFIKVQKMLEEQNLLNRKRKKLSAELYFWLAERWLLLKKKR